jgi:hypothetical protein
LGARRSFGRSSGSSKSEGSSFFSFRTFKCCTILSHGMTRVKRSFAGFVVADPRAAALHGGSAWIGGFRQRPNDVNGTCIAESSCDVSFRSSGEIPKRRTPQPSTLTLGDLVRSDLTVSIRIFCTAFTSRSAVDAQREQRWTRTIGCAHRRVRTGALTLVRRQVTELRQIRVVSAEGQRRSRGLPGLSAHRHLRVCTSPCARSHGAGW